MNNIIKQGLQKCTIDLPPWDDDTTELIIKKTTKDEKPKEVELIVDIERDKYYIIKLKYYIINPPSNFTLSSNWNKGINPTSEYLLGTPTKFVGKMIQWDACGYDYKNRQSLDDVYSELWLPSKGFDVVERV